MALLNEAAISSRSASLKICSLSSLSMSHLMKTSDISCGHCKLQSVSSNRLSIVPVAPCGELCLAMRHSSFNSLAWRSIRDRMTVARKALSFLSAAILLDLASAARMMLSNVRVFRFGLEAALDSKFIAITKVGQSRTTC